MCEDHLKRPPGIRSKTNAEITRFMKDTVTNNTGKAYMFVYYWNEGELHGGYLLCDNLLPIPVPTSADLVMAL